MPDSIQLDRSRLVEIRPVPLRPLHKKVLVAPLYDADQIGSIFLPDIAKNPQSQQGIVVAAGRESEFQVHDHLLFEPYNGKPLRYEGREYLALEDDTIIGRFDGEFIEPRSDAVVVAPNFEQKGVVQRGSIVVIQQVFEHPPVQTGTVVRVGSAVDNIRPGTTVAIPPSGGHEIGLSFPDHSGVYYFIPASAILAQL